jgi:hypothetical protein
MFTRSRNVGLVLSSVILFGASAWATPSVLEGIVKDPKGQPIKGADVRIEARDGGKLFKTVKTDVNGHYVSDGLPVGTYRVTLIVNGTVKASINNAKTKAGGPTQLNFELKSASASQAAGSAKKAKHMVWVPPKTGTHTGGGWVEVDDNGSAEAGFLNVKQVSAEELQRQIRSAPVQGTGH